MRRTGMKRKQLIVDAVALLLMFAGCWVLGHLVGGALRLLGVA